MTTALEQQYYTALTNRDAEYNGIIFVGVKSTGIFCLPTCPAKKPKIENCEWFKHAEDALLAGYRPCKRCHPTAMPDDASPIIKALIKAVEKEPEKRWKEGDARDIGYDPSTVRRHFKKRFGISFVAYARARRMGLALKHIRGGGRVIDAQIDHGYESDSGFRDAFARIMGTPPSKHSHIILESKLINTPIGAMIAMADEHALYLLEFTNRRGLELEVDRMRKKLGCAIVPGNNAILQQTEIELAEYYSGTRQKFDIPLSDYGTDFQKTVWNALRTLPYGETCSYAALAKMVGNENAVRAVARANGANQCALIIPCHRVIGSDGSLTGYAGGLARKEWLLAHEGKILKV